MQLNLDCFSQEGMGRKPAFGINLRQCSSTPPHPGCKRANNEINQRQSKIASHESGDQQKHDEQRKECARHTK
jgi:hypothetical protein